VLAVAVVLVFLVGLLAVLVRVAGGNDGAPTTTTAPATTTTTAPATTTTTATTTPADPDGAGTVDPGETDDTNGSDDQAAPEGTAPGTATTTTTTTTAPPAARPGADEVAAPPSGLGAGDPGAPRSELADTGAPPGGLGGTAVLGLVALLAGGLLRRSSAPRR
jgi:hypothetical protein